MARKRKVKLNIGASKALAAMKKRYGSARGRAIFYARASKYGQKGLRPSQKVNQTSGKGKHRIRSINRRRRKS